jgi:hypothetical protein
MNGLMVLRRRAVPASATAPRAGLSAPLGFRTEANLIQNLTVALWREERVEICDVRISARGRPEIG